jgi:hypothetical protein
MKNERLSFELIGFQNCLVVLSGLCQGKVKGRFLYENVSTAMQPFPRAGLVALLYIYCGLYLPISLVYGRRCRIT